MRVSQPLQPQTIPASSAPGQLGLWESYQSAGVCSIDTEEGNRRLGCCAAGCGGSVATGEAGGNGGAGDTSPESGAESSCGRHGGWRGDGLRDGRASEGFGVAVAMLT